MIPIDETPIYLYRDPVDFRKSINGLAIIVEGDMGRNPFGKGLFIFSNRQRDKIKLLYWDKTGFALWYKRLEKHRFKWPRNSNTAELTLEVDQLHRLLGGFDIIGHPALNFKSAQ